MDGSNPPVQQMQHQRQARQQQQQPLQPPASMPAQQQQPFQTAQQYQGFQNRGSHGRFSGQSVMPQQQGQPLAPQQYSQADMYRGGQRVPQMDSQQQMHPPGMPSGNAGRNVAFSGGSGLKPPPGIDPLSRARSAPAVGSYNPSSTVQSRQR